MKYTVSDRRKAENEVIFRQYNERIQRGFDEIKKVAKEDGQEDLVPDHDLGELHFLCECSDENCHQRISLTPARYNQIHRHSNRFIAVPGHETDRIEQVIDQPSPHYCVIEKSLVPKVTAQGLGALNTTDVNNA